MIFLFLRNDYLLLNDFVTDEIENFKQLRNYIDSPDESNVFLHFEGWHKILNKAEGFYLRHSSHVTNDKGKVLNTLLVTAMNI